LTSLLFITGVFIFASIIIIRKKKYPKENKSLARAQRFSELHEKKYLTLRKETTEEKQLAEKEQKKRQKQINAWRRQIIMAALATLIFLSITLYQTFFSPT
jgi:uncharacterized membrane protein YozB (DUF420 family)